MITTAHQIALAEIEGFTDCWLGFWDAETVRFVPHPSGHLTGLTPKTKNRTSVSAYDSLDDIQRVFTALTREQKSAVAAYIYKAHKRQRTGDAPIKLQFEASRELWAEAILRAAGRWIDPVPPTFGEWCIKNAQRMDAEEFDRLYAEYQRLYGASKATT